jgi:hypothetical protein
MEGELLNVIPAKAGIHFETMTYLIRKIGDTMRHRVPDFLEMRHRVPDFLDSCL